MANHPNRSKHSGKVVTYQSPSGGALDVCTQCAKVLERANTWPRDAGGREYCAVSHGLHDGRCDLGR